MRPQGVGTCPQDSLVRSKALVVADRRFPSPENLPRVGAGMCHRLGRTMAMRPMLASISVMTALPSTSHATRKHLKHCRPS